MKDSRKILSVVALIGAFALGSLYGRTSGASKSTEALLNGASIANTGRTATLDFQNGADADLYLKVKEIIQDRYLHAPVDEKKLFYGSIQGMVASLDDPYSTFFDPEQVEDFANLLAGTFEGIGAEIAMKDNFITIVAPLPDSPAERAGLLAKDIIAKIDETETTGLTVDEAVQKIRGPAGTPVKLMIFRKGFKEPKLYTLTRSEIIFQSVRSKIVDSNVGLIEIFHFNDETPRLFADAVGTLLKKRPRGIVLDLRNNPGGVLESAVEVLGEWIPNEVAVQTRSREKVTNTTVSFGLGRLKGIATVVLVNGGSASASEIVAGALQDYKSATLVGEQTFGKGVVQELEDLDGGTQLKVTIAEWLTGKGRSIDKVGVTPDVKVERTADDMERDRDPQMTKAFQILKK